MAMARICAESFLSATALIVYSSSSPPHRVGGLEKRARGGGCAGISASVCHYHCLLSLYHPIGMGGRHQSRYRLYSRGFFFSLRIPRPAANDDGFIFTAGKHQTTRCLLLLGAKCQRASGVQVQVKNIQRPLACFYRLHGWARGLSWLAAMESPGFVIVIMPLICFPTTTIQFADIKSHTQKINHRDLLPQAAWKRPTQNHGRTPRRKSLMPWLYHTFAC